MHMTNIHNTNIFNIIQILCYIQLLQKIILINTIQVENNKKDIHFFLNI
jgi:hypothetical protein